jgi:hypothetical protein
MVRTDEMGMAKEAETAVELYIGEAGASNTGTTG